MSSWYIFISLLAWSAICVFSDCLYAAMLSLNWVSSPDMISCCFFYTPGIVEMRYNKLDIGVKLSDLVPNLYDALLGLADPLLYLQLQSFRLPFLSPQITMCHNTSFSKRLSMVSNTVSLSCDLYIAKFSSSSWARCCLS